jgi:hypothetical protein
VVPGVPEIACRSSAFPGNGGADWRSSEVGSPEDGLLVLPVVGNPPRTPCNRVTEEGDLECLEDTFSWVHEDPIPLNSVEESS